ncbi:MAG: alpha/beta hydrolase [Chloroflexi bacterium]|nr:alpha/beta hydrolase [Chloroflexota bacterium]
MITLPFTGSESWTHAEREIFNSGLQTPIVFNVVQPTLEPILPAAGAGNGRAVVICPGGGFHLLAIQHEGTDVARWLAARGVACFILRYRLAQCFTDDPGAEFNARWQAGRASLDEFLAPTVRLAMADGLAAVRHVRANAAAWGVDPARVGIMGFSAGGAVTASVALNYDADSRPAFAAPIYLPYNMVPGCGVVPADAPPLFLCAAADDSLGLAPDSVRMYEDWTAAGRVAELHMYARGDHGFGMRRLGLPVDGWIERFAEWMEWVTA